MTQSLVLKLKISFWEPKLKAHVSRQSHFLVPIEIRSNKIVLQEP